MAPVFLLAATAAACSPLSAAYAELTSRLPPVPCRDDLAKLAESTFHQLGRAVEIGVNEGKFSAKNLALWSGQYVLVDYWNHRPADMHRDHNQLDHRLHQLRYQQAMGRTQPFNASGRVPVVRKMSVAAAADFPDEHFDWIYVDALHTYKAVLADVRAWWPKLRPGGLMSGDDYGNVDMPMELLNASRWRSHFKFDPSPFRWNTVSAVQKFAAEQCVAVHITWLHDCYQFPAWYAVKPL